MNIFKKNTILIVEDEVSLRNALCDKFKREGFNVFEAKDGEVGLVVARKEKPDIILLDIVMPKMDGMSMLKKLRADGPWSKSVPVMLLTNLGADDKEMAKDIVEDELTSYLVKSNWAINDVVKKVKERLQNKA
ncbi:MAG: response regulator [Patescibacteria group bacterium]